MLLEVEQKLDWENIENYRGKHDILKEFFIDKDAKSYAMVGNKEYIITRDYHKEKDVVSFSIFTRMSYIIGNYKNLVDNGIVEKYFANKNK